MNKKHFLLAFEIGSVALFSALLLGAIYFGVSDYFGGGHQFPHLNV